MALSEGQDTRTVCESRREVSWGVEDWEEDCAALLWRRGGWGAMDAMVAVWKGVFCAESCDVTWCG